MLPHLHLHLEPEERKRRLGGVPGSRPTHGREQFFAGRDLSRADRIPVDAAELATFIRALHAEQRAQGVDYVELRLSPRRFVVDGLALAGFLTVAHRVMADLRGPEVRGILLVNRDSPDMFLAEVRAVLPGLPETFVGIDLAGDEARYPNDGRFAPLCAEAAAVGLGVTVHAGEFGELASIWHAIDVLGARRIGHGVGAAGSRALLRRLAADRTLVEVSISSNLALGAVVAGDPHPVASLLAAGVPVCFNTDIPLQTGVDLGEELALASALLRLDAGEVFRLQCQAATHRFARVPEGRLSGGGR